MKSNPIRKGKHRKRGSGASSGSTEQDAGAAPRSHEEMHQRPTEPQIQQNELEPRNQTLANACREAEANLRHYADLYDFALIGCFTLDRQGTIRQANITGAEMLGRNPAELLQRRFDACLREESRPGFEAFLARAFENGSREPYEAALAPDGHGGRHVRLEARIDDGGATCRLVAVDISGCKRLEEEREYLQRQLQQARKRQALGLLARALTHEFNNILGTVLGYTDLALERYARDPASKLSEYLREVRTAGQRARVLVDQLRILSHDSLAPVCPPLAPHKALADLLPLLASDIPSHIELHTHLEATAAILIDTADLRQVLAHVLENARQAMDATLSGRIHVELRMMVPEGSYCNSCHRFMEGNFVAIEVRDSGAGIAEEILPRIFDPFFTTRQINGAGIGLPLVHGIMHQAGGHILVESWPGNGARFRLLFPAVPLPAEIGIPADDRHLR